MIESKEIIKAKRFAFETIGCRLNQYESEKMANQLSLLGLERVNYDQIADLYLINTCTVTGRADASCRNSISRAVKMGNEAIVIVIGCFVDSEPNKAIELNGVHLVISNKNKNKLIDILKINYPALFDKEMPIVQSDSLTEFYHHSRTWVKISDGCNQRCAYCIIPHVRGRLNNRSASEIVEEINMLSKNGYHEVVLTGVHIGQYGWKNVTSIADLTQYILDNTTISRLRLSSIEPQEVDTELIAVMKNGGQRICRYLHIPLQSGSNHVLKMMHRPYSINNYINKLRDVKNSIDGIIIGADIIVGFPGETDKDFEDSVTIAQSGLIDYLHVFSYSDRPGTESSMMPDKVGSKIIKSRSKILRDISDTNYKSALQKEVGQTVYAVSESGTHKEGQHHWGVTDNYLKIILPDNLGRDREIVKLKVIEAKDKYLIGTI